MEYILYPLVAFLFLVWVFAPLIVSHALMDKVFYFFQGRKYGFEFSLNMACIAYLFACAFYYGIPITFIILSLSEAN